MKKLVLVLFVALIQTNESWAGTTCENAIKLATGISSFESNSGGGGIIRRFPQMDIFEANGEDFLQSTGLVNNGPKSDFRASRYQEQTPSGTSVDVYKADNYAGWLAIKVYKGPHGATEIQEVRDGEARSLVFDYSTGTCQVKEYTRGKVVAGVWKETAYASPEICQALPPYIKEIKQKIAQAKILDKQISHWEKSRPYKNSFPRGELWAAMEKQRSLDQEVQSINALDQKIQNNGKAMYEIEHSSKIPADMVPDLTAKYTAKEVDLVAQRSKMRSLEDVEKDRVAATNAMDNGTSEIAQMVEDAKIRGRFDSKKIIPGPSWLKGDFDEKTDLDVSIQVKDAILNFDVKKEIISRTLENLGQVPRTEVNEIRALRDQAYPEGGAINKEKEDQLLEKLELTGSLTYAHVEDAVWSSFSAVLIRSNLCEGLGFTEKQNSAPAKTKSAAQISNR